MDVECPQDRIDVCYTSVLTGCFGTVLFRACDREVTCPPPSPSILKGFTVEGLIVQGSFLFHMRVGGCCRTKEAAEKALVEMNEATVGQWKIRCGWAHHKTEAVTGLDAETVDRADPANTNVYVGNLASEVSFLRSACLGINRQ